MQVCPSLGDLQQKNILFLLSFVHRNKIGLLTFFAKINKRGGLNKVRAGGKKI